MFVTARALAAVAVGLIASSLLAHASRQGGEPAWQAFIAAAGTDERSARQALTEIAAGWRPGYAAMVLDVARLLPSPGRVAGGGAQGIPTSDDPDLAGALRSEFPEPTRERPGALARRRLTDFLERQTGQRFGDDLRRWRRWIWSQPYAPHADYAQFKGEVYARLDPAFRAFFPKGVRASIRLDEIDWGGVAVNGIPPLRLPKAIPAREATWLKDTHVVFGIESEGHARAYPKRILAWHELATDRFAGRHLTVVYCTLCGTVIPYDSDAGGRRFTFGTSGLLYRSNKLMFDEETRSLWSAVAGTPVVGALVDSGLRLRALPIVTTTWGEWRREHPGTDVLSIETGFDRDYSEGAAYRDYFSTDRTMFEVPAPDTRLRNKAEVLVIRPELIAGGAPPVAIAVDRLRREPVFSFDAGGRGFVVVSSRDNANRVYERSGRVFAKVDPAGRVVDADGRQWTPAADALVGPAGERLPRVAAHRAFWFGWHAQYPDTVLYR